MRYSNAVRWIAALGALVALGGVLGIAGPARADVIREIVVEENHKTTAETVKLIARIQVGDEWTADMTDRVRRDLVTSGLFRDVVVFHETVPGGIRVHLLVKDKHSWVIAPAIYSQPTNKGGGLGFGENNLFGLNQKLLLYGQVASGDSFFIGAWVIPSLGGTRFYAQLDTFLKTSRQIEYSSPVTYLGRVKKVRHSRINYLNAGARLGIELAQGIKLDARLRGAHVSYSDSPNRLHLSEGATLDDLVVDPDDPTAVPKPGAEGYDVSSEIDFSIDRRANYYGIQSGYKLGLGFETALPSLGSDFRYWIATVGYYRARQILERHNLVYRANLHVGHRVPFQQEFLTGGSSMRGYLNGEFRGDVRALVNLEYSVPFVTVKGLSVRLHAFVDSAYTTFITRQEDNPQRNYMPEHRAHLSGGLAPFKNSVGLGTRLYLRQIVLPLLGVDVGYGIEARDVQVYLAIGLTD